MIEIDIGMRDKVFRIATVNANKDALAMAVARQLKKRGYGPEDYFIKDGYKIKHNPSIEAVSAAYNEISEQRTNRG